MTMTTGEAVLQALLSALNTIAGPTRSVERNTAVAQTVPANGLVILRDGDPSVTDVLLGDEGPFYYSHAVEIELYVQVGDPVQRDLRFDALRQAVGQALDADPTLGGAIHGMTYGAPAANPEPIEGGEALKTGAITVTVEYQSGTRI